MDITFKTEEGNFNYRVCGVIVHNNQLLAMRDKRSPYYYLPGGRVELHETAEEAVLRELKEELDIDAAIIRPLWLNQGFFVEDVTKERYHELCLYFLIDISSTDLLNRGRQFTCVDGRLLLEHEWLPFDQLENTYLYPIFIKDAIQHLPESLQLIHEYQ